MSLLKAVSTGLLHHSQQNHHQLPVFMNAINTLVLKLIICSACTCITGEGVSAYVVEFTGFSISR